LGEVLTLPLLPLLDAGLGFFLLLGGIFPLRPSSRRRSFHLRNSTALAGFLILGLDSLWLLMATAVLAALCPFRLQHVDTDITAGRILFRRPESHREEAFSVLLDASFLSLAIVAAHFYYTRLTGGSYPVPLATTRDVLVFLSVTFLTSLLIAVLSESYYRLLGPGRESSLEEGWDSMGLPPDAPLYSLILVIGTPLQLLAHFLYLSYGLVPFLVGLIWFGLFVVLHSLLLHRRRQLRLLFHDLEVSHRLAALGEVTNRIAHQTRHQLGLIGITVHMIRDALEGGGRIDGSKIRQELDRLEGVARSLREMLAGDLLGDTPMPAGRSILPASFMDLVNRETEVLHGKAASRGVSVRVEGDRKLSPARGPREVQRLAQGIFNVLENALSAATSVVDVEVVATADHIEIAISDDGRGMSEEFLQRATEPFTTTKKDGTGMGLAIALAAARLWDGDLLLENRADGGLRATFQLPLDRTADQNDRVEFPTSAHDRVTPKT
jgi:signal transduction histidine kinase